MLQLIDRLAAAWLHWRTSQAAARVTEESGITFKRAEVTPSGFDIQLNAPNLLYLVEEASAMLHGYEAENYLEINMLPRFNQTKGRPIRVTIQWMLKESPAEQNARLRAEVARLREELIIIANAPRASYAHPTLYGAALLKAKKAVLAWLDAEDAAGQGEERDGQVDAARNGLIDAGLALRALED